MVSESGIASRDDMIRLHQAGVKAALIGESLMRSADQNLTLKEFLAI